ncbi:MAG: zinc transporter permease, partial [Rhodoferax sp.]|nr:zinc transporter permease [Rhodoferax sp.]
CSSDLTLGTLMAVGLMMIPAVSARLWHHTLAAQLVNASVQAMLAGTFGLLLSYHLDTPSGPTIIGCAGALYGLSLLLAPGGWLPRRVTRVHRLA